MFWKLVNWAFGKVAKDVADKEYGSGQTAYKPEPSPPPKPKELKK